MPIALRGARDNIRRGGPTAGRVAVRGGVRMENRLICKCKNVTLFDVDDALHNCKTFPEVEKTFIEVQKITHCSTGCGGCHDKILDAISELMHR